MDNAPTVSIVMSFLDAAKYIQEAIQSVYDQTYSDWELLLIDDGSGDGSSEIALSCRERDPERVKYFDHPCHQNRGRATSRNVGLEQARGKYVAILDADDAWLPGKLREQVAIMRSYPDTAMVCGNSEYWYGWTGDPRDAKRDFVPELPILADRLYEPPSLLKVRLTQNWSPCPSDLLFERETLLRLGGFEEDFAGMYGMYEDQALLTKICLHAVVFQAGRCWDKYRVHDESFCAVVTSAGHEPTVRRFYLKWLTQYLADNGVTDRRIWREIRRAKWISRLPILTNFARTISGLR